MEFSAFLVFAVWTSSMTYLSFGKERERAMVFPDYYFFAERRLVKHTIETRKVENFDDCELLCYLNDNCVSLNFKKDPDKNEVVHICELNNATHLKHDNELATDAMFYYRGSKNACDKSSNCQNNATCQSGFTFKGYRCLCPPGFEGERCEKDVDECNGNQSCHEDAKCTNTIGSHVCECQSGYTGDGQNCTADPCYHYENLSAADRNIINITPERGQALCDRPFSEGWYRFVGAAGTKMPTTRVPAYRCGTDWSGWLDDAHPTVEDGTFQKKVCFSDRSSGCKFSNKIFVKKCGSYFIYKLHHAPTCNSRYCGTD